MFAADWHLGTNGIFCYHGRYQDYFQPLVDSCEREAVKSGYRAYKYVCKDVLLFVYIYVCIYGLEVHSSWECWGGSTLLLFPRSPKSAVPASCADEGSFPPQGTGKPISQVNGFVQLQPSSLPLRWMHHQPVWLKWPSFNLSGWNYSLDHGIIKCRYLLALLALQKMHYLHYLHYKK